MGNPTSKIDFSIPLATFLASVESNGTFSDILETLKIDKVGEEGDALTVRIAATQLWSNLVDDFMLAAYPILESELFTTHDTSDATPLDITIADIVTDFGGVGNINLVVVARTASPAQCLTAALRGQFYDDGGTLGINEPITTLAENGLAGASAVLVNTVGTTLVARLQGLVSTDIRWTIYRANRSVVAP